MRKFIGVICSFICPPLGVIVGGGTFIDLFFNCILTFFFWIPGLIHALKVVLYHEDEKSTNLNETQTK